MRRMYSQAELSAIIKEVFLEDVASGQIDLPDLIEQALPEVDFSTADFSSVDFVAKTLKQTNSNWEEDFTLPSVSGFTKANEYCRLEEINGILHLVICALYENSSGASASFSLGSIVFSNIDESISSKIYTAGGQKVSEPVSSTYAERYIRVAVMGVSSAGVSTNLTQCILLHTGANEMTLYHTTSVTIGSSATAVASCEINLTLL